ncbi:unnamed protein product [Ixodes pacificus]
MDSSTSWVVAAGCCWTNFFSYAVFRSAAIVYVAILNSLDTTRAEAAWPVTIMGILSCVAGPVVGWLATRVPVWKLSVCACLVGALSISACFFANGTWFLIASIGIVHGISMSFTNLCNTVIKAHFTQRRALACGISFAGLTVSGLVFPPLLQFLLENYGPKGMFLVTGALMLNATGGALLQRIPPETPCKSASVLNENKRHDIYLYKTDSNKSDTQECPKDSIGAALTTEDDHFLAQNGFPHKNGATQGVSHPLNVTQALSSQSKTTTDPGYGKQNESQEKKCVNPHYAHDDVDGVHDETATYCMESSSNQNKVSSPSYLRHPKFYIIAFASSVIVFNMSTYSTVTVDFATDRNVSEWNAVLLLMMYAIADLVSRLGSGWFTDKGFLAKSSMMTANLFLWALSLCVMPFCYSFYLHAIQAVVVGWCNGATLILIPVLLMELVNTDKFSECFGVALLISGIPLLLRPVLIGYFRDDLGDYQGLFVVMGVVTAISAFSCLFLREIPGEKGFLYHASELFCYKKRHANHNETKGDKDIYLEVKMNQHESIA